MSDLTVDLYGYPYMTLAIRPGGSASGYDCPWDGSRVSPSGSPA